MSRTEPFQLRIGKHVFLILLAGGILAGFVNLVHPDRIPWVQDWSIYVESRAKAARVEIIPLNAAYSIHQADNHLFIDARAFSEFTKGHISEAFSLPFEEMDNHFEEMMQLLETETPLVVYCRNRECDDALLLAIQLRDMGQSNLYYYVDGYELWKEAGCPTETD